MDPRLQNGGLGGGQTRAERFEEQKKRIVDSCFNKKDPADGSLLETYITHIRITEFSSHPSSPPTPDARNTQAEKPRVIIVAVRKSGRVRMHKSKENANGSFSIGKTWDMNDLTSIQSFTDPSIDPQKREWAGDTGFIINIGKPYYWQAQADKEKKFFIASLIKIYAKYTGGGVPELQGFDQRELDQVLGSRKPPSQPPPPGPTSVPRAPPQPPFDPSRSGPIPPQSREPSATGSGRDIKPYRPPPGPGGPGPSSSPSRNLGAPPPPTNRSNVSLASSVDSSRAGSQPPALRRLAANNPSQDSVSASISTSRSDDASSIPPRSRGGLPGPAPGRFGDPQQGPHKKPIQPKDLPDRRRPPMDPSWLQGTPDADLVPAPLMSPGRREPPPRNSERLSSSRKNSVGPQSRPGSSKELNPTPSSPAPIPSPESRREPSPQPRSMNGGGFPEASTPPPPVPPPSEPLPETPSTPVEPEETRPGLGPMIRSKKSKGELAAGMMKAASAANAFKPRPGGAGERLRELQRQAALEPDGVKGVIPAPPKPTPPEETKAAERIIPTPPPQQELPEPPQKSDSPVPEVTVTPSETAKPFTPEAAPHEPAKPESRPQSSEGDAKKQKDEPRKSVIGNDAKYLAALGLDTTLSLSASSEFTTMLDDFGWIPGDQMRNRVFDEMKLDIDRELNKAQAGGWVARFQEEDERVDAIKKGLDVSISECEELDNLLTLYSVELSTLSEDIAYIEAQGQGLQVQAANQKLLRRELESLLDTCAITSNDLQALSMAPLETSVGLEEIEISLVTLYKAMMKIDSSLAGQEIRKSEDTTITDQQPLNSDYSKMRIVQEKRQMYLQENSAFLQKLLAFSARHFDKAASNTKTSLDGALSKKVDPRHHEIGREYLWKYSPLMVYAREMDLEIWNRMIQLYQDANGTLYRDEFSDVLAVWKKNARKPTGEEMDLLFTAQIEKQQESTMTAARKLTVKRSQTLAKTVRAPLGQGNKGKKSADGRVHPYEVFAGIVDDLLPLVEMEQNFIIDFFHATTLETADFPDLVLAAKPRERRGGDLRRPRLMEPDRDLARRVTRAMEAIFSFLEKNLQDSVNWVLSQDPLQGVGVLAALERKQTEITQSNQDFLNAILQKIHGSLESRFTKFVDEQLRAIEETKVKIKKRKGVISFMRVFPHFSATVENMLGTADTSSSARRTVDREYERIIKSMFDSLKVIARENPATLTNSGADPEDKEALNFHILLIENMNHFVEELDSHGLEVLEDWKQVASNEFNEHMSLYLNAVMRRPLGKLLEYLENIEGQLASGKPASTIAAQPSNAKGTFSKILTSYDAKEVRKGVETLRKRVEKHFTADAEDSDHHSSSRGLVNRVLQECEKFYNDIEVRINTVTTTVYRGDVLFEWPRAEVKMAFK